MIEIEIMSVLQSIAELSFLAFIVLSLCGLILPTFLFWRVEALSLLALFVGFLIEGPTHHSNQNVSYVIGLFVVVLYIIVVLILISARLIFFAVRRKYSIFELFGCEHNSRNILDVVLLVTLGCALGMSITIALAHLLAGTSGGLGLDLGVFFVSAAFAIALRYRVTGMMSVAISAALVTIALSALVGSFQSSRILKSAEALADDRDWCLTTSSRSPQIYELGQLGFFSLPKHDAYPHLGLMVRDADQVTMIAHWSVRQQRFVDSGKVIEFVPTCNPLKNFGSALRNNAVR